MGNIMEIRDSSDKLVARASLGLSCALYAQGVCRKYKKDFNMFLHKDINKQLEEVYNKCTLEVHYS